MERSLNFTEILENIPSPAFAVENGVIVQANQAAQKRLFSVGADIADYIMIGAEEYAEFTEGKLCLTLSVFDAPVNVTVVNCDQYHVFYLESDYAEAELRAFALAAQHLREPLANAMTCANGLISDIAPEDSPELYQLNKNLYRLHRAICNMSDAAHHQNARSSRFEYREIGSIFSEVMEKTAQLLSVGKHKLEYTGLSKPVSTLVDAEKLERALLNMVSNSVKFSPKGSTIEVSLRSSGTKLYFTVRNICAKEACNQSGNIYANYLREPGIDNPNIGIGLGMTIVRKTAAAHGGTLLLEQSESFGIRFTMTIPIESLKSPKLRSGIRLPVDYAGAYDHTLTELSDILPAELYR